MYKGRFVLRTIYKLLVLFKKCVQEKRLLKAKEIAEVIDCSVSHAYKYRKSLEHLFSIIQQEATEV